MAKKSRKFTYVIHMGAGEFTIRDLANNSLYDLKGANSETLSLVASNISNALKY